MAPFDALYPQDNGESALMQLQVQLASAMPYDLDTVELAEYKHLNARWHRWGAVQAVCAQVAQTLFVSVTKPAHRPA